MGGEAVVVSASTSVEEGVAEEAVVLGSSLSRTAEMRIVCSPMICNVRSVRYRIQRAVGWSYQFFALWITSRMSVDGTA